MSDNGWGDAFYAYNPDEQPLDPWGYDAMLNMAGVGQMPIEQNRYGPIAYDIGTENQQLTAAKKRMDLLTNPDFAMMLSGAGVPGLLDYNQFAGQDVAQATPPPMMWTPNLDSLRSGGQVGQNIAQMVEAGASQPEINQAMRLMRQEGQIPDDDAFADYSTAAQAAVKDFQESQRGQAEYQHTLATTPAEQTPLQKNAQAAGLPDPLGQYGDASNPFPFQLDVGDSENAARGQRAASALPGLQRAAQSAGQAQYDELAKTSTLGRRVEHQMPDRGGLLARINGSFDPLGFASKTASGGLQAGGNMLASAARGLFGGGRAEAAEPRVSDDVWARVAANQGGVTPVDAGPDSAFQRASNKAGVARRSTPAQAKKTQAVKEAGYKVKDAERQVRGSAYMSERRQAEGTRIAQQIMSQNGRTPYGDATQARMAAMMRMLNGG